MPVTLLINGHTLRSADHRCLTRATGTVRQQTAFTMSDRLRDELLNTAAVLRGVTRPSGNPDEAQPRRRLLYRDALDVLEEKQRISKIQVQAGREIGRVHAAVMSGGPDLAQARYGHVVHGDGGDGLPASLMPAHRDRYRPWRQWAEGEMAAKRCHQALSEVTLKLCFENLGIRQIGDRLGLDQRTVMTAIQRSLWAYCRIAGWVSDEAA